MSVMRIIVNSSELTIDAVQSFRNIVGESIGELRSAMKNGTPIFDEEIFTNICEENATKCCNLLKEIDIHRLTHTISKLKMIWMSYFAKYSGFL
ncbi:hypothetical protein A3196_15385 [Candidatus Thiodiazotropha endoloripes]|uniref:Uncharacterized protein n=1 Tax=Candidatus Thiodiazotropha endoloripes TaxID=1818881 RepID=A0A1E2UTD2_9GAMM|nr:hypothetical protein A3196_15385 [Candidatus Thiodiazotropha endoloripes]